MIEFEKSFHEQARAAMEQSGYIFVYTIKYRNKGNAIGTCLMLCDGAFEFKFSREAIRLDYEHMTRQTIPHELAHAICLNRGGHGVAWQRVCKALGGTGKAYHDLPVTPARVSRRFLYILPSGVEVILKTVRHIRLQRGVRYRHRPTGESFGGENFSKELTE